MGSEEAELLFLLLVVVLFLLLVVLLFVLVAELPVELVESVEVAEPDDASEVTVPSDEVFSPPEVVSLLLVSSSDSKPMLTSPQASNSSEVND